MNGELLNDGGPVTVTTPRDRIGHGPWSRLLASAVVPDESSPTAERGRELARGGNVYGVGVAKGAITARVDDENVTLTAEPVPPRIWSAVYRSTRGKDPLEAAAEGREQSVHLEHLMAFDWEEPLVPRTQSLGRTCTCPLGRGCEHVAAAAYVIADAIDRDPGLLLRWRGCEPPQAESEEPAAPVPLRSATSADPWRAGPLPAPRPLRPLPAGAILKCLGPSGVPLGGRDVAEVLQRAYVAFAAAETR
jgi:uncharacterized Zn finger protein